MVHVERGKSGEAMRGAVRKGMRRRRGLVRCIVGGLVVVSVDLVVAETK